MRSDEAEEYRPIRSLLRRLIKAPAMFAILWPALLVVGGYVGWQRWGSEHVIPQFQGIDPSQITIPEPPAYIRSNIVKAVYDDTAMDRLSLLDRQATAKIASAFSMHPWVRSVVGVRKLPGGAIDIRLDYRSPVAMVLGFKTDPTDRRAYFLPVDGDGVVLPSGEFGPSETKNFVHIEVPGVDPLGRLVGSPFGDARVESAAALAEMLHPYRQQIGLRSIGVPGDPRQSVVPQLELTKHDGTRFFWGSPPGAEEPGERTAAMKLRALIDASGAESTDLRVASPGLGTR